MGKGNNPSLGMIFFAFILVCGKKILPSIRKNFEKTQKMWDTIFINLRVLIKQYLNNSIF